MFSARRRGAARLAVTALTTGLFAAGAISGAGSAFADTTPTTGGATAVLDGLRTADRAILHEDDKEREIGAGLFEMAVDNGGSIQTYCIDIHNPTQEDATYQEVSWGESSLGANADAGRIHWILQHSYPQVNSLDELAETAGTGTLTPELAAAGTQVAIWRFSDGVEVEAKDPEAEKLADYLEKSAQDAPEPKASLTLDPPAVSGKAGEKLGPITVGTNADTVTVGPDPAAAASGVTIVDKDGKPVTSAVNGSQLFFDVPADAEDGTASLTAEATTKVPVGRVFTGSGVNSLSQTMILAGSSASTVPATATATWAAEGPIPAVSAEVNCAKGGVDVTASNQGDEPFTFQLAGKEHTVGAGESETITVPVAEDQAYKITLSGPDGFEETFEGVLDCKTTSTSGDTTGGPSSEPSPASAGGSTTEGTTGGDLAETGSSSATPLIAGSAVVLLLVGGGTVFFLRRKKTATGPAE